MKKAYIFLMVSGLSVSVAAQNKDVDQQADLKMIVVPRHLKGVSVCELSAAMSAGNYGHTIGLEEEHKGYWLPPNSDMSLRVHQGRVSDFDCVEGESITILLVFFNRAVTYDEAIAEIIKHGYRPVTFNELLTLVPQHPNLLATFNKIIALGTLFKDEPFGPDQVAYLQGNHKGQNLLQDLKSRSWFKGSHFAVRE